MLTIKVHTGGSAFDDRPEYELARILRECANYLETKADFEDRAYSNKLMDIYGNSVGEIRVTNTRR